MAETSNIVLQQVERYEQDSWKIQHAQAQACGELEDWLDFGLGVLNTIQRLEKRYNAQLASGERPFDQKKIELVDTLYMHWFAPCDHLLNLIREFENSGFPVKNGREYADACEKCHIEGFDSISLLEAETDYLRNGGTPLAKAFDELRTHYQQPG